MRTRVIRAEQCTSKTVCNDLLKDANTFIPIINKNWENYTSTYLSQDEKILANRFTETWKIYYNIILEVENFILEGNVAAQQISSTKALKAFSDVAETIRKLIDIQIKISKEEYDKSNLTYSKMKRISIIGSLFTIISSLFLTQIIIRSIVKPISELIYIINQLTKGNLDTDVSNTDRKDEIGSIARAILIFKQEAVKKRKIDEELLLNKKKFEQEHDFIKCISITFEEHICNVTGFMSCFIEKLSSSSNKLIFDASEVLEQSSDVFKFSTEVISVVQTIAASTEEFSYEGSEILKQINTIQSVSTESNNEIINTVNIFKELKNYIDNIGNIVNIIKDIATKTNLLSLNATIEASRSGETNKGFSVIANEIKLLSVQTKKSIEEISNQINKVQLKTTEVLLAINKVSEIISFINEIINNVSTITYKQTASTKEIVRNIEQAYINTSNLSDRIQIVKHFSRNSEETSIYVKQLVDGLSEQIDLLNKEVLYFLSNFNK